MAEKPIPRAKLISTIEALTRENLTLKEQLRNERAILRTPQGIVDAVSYHLNQMSWKADAFVEAMRREHRTLQQQFMMLCLAWIWHMAHTDEVDGRNQYSHDTAKRIVQNAPLERFDVRVPFI